ncbi:hypothetical protein [uncultured Tenacibaculum sp.]|uniref:hypothetical protein n=1 Tax=uncultured Tenacibaculum sp. TaxID=174713 RepID=UPI0026219E3B|nr:hypothetical protein [uncultured Tenacibaculum sp.]
MFSLILLTSIVLPTYLVINNFNCEVSLEIDMEEDGEETEISKDIEIKIVSVLPNFRTYFHKTIQKNIIYISIEYNSIFRNLESPPPEFYS